MHLLRLAAPADFAAVADFMASAGLGHLDVAVANAGSSAGFLDVLSTDPADVLADVEVNAVGPMRLFAAAWPFLEKGADKKFVVMTSSVGSIGSLEEEAFPSTAYGMSKAALNWSARFHIILSRLSGAEGRHTRLTRFHVAGMQRS